MNSFDGKLVLPIIPPGAILHFGLPSCALKDNGFSVLEDAKQGFGGMNEVATLNGAVLPVATYGRSAHLEKFRADVEQLLPDGVSGKDGGRENEGERFVPWDQPSVWTTHNGVSCRF
jgi:hypothetical protein